MASLSSRRQFLPPIDSPLDLFSPQRSPPLHSPSPWVPITTNMSLLTPLEEEDEGDDDDLSKFTSLLLSLFSLPLFAAQADASLLALI